MPLVVHLQISSRTVVQWTRVRPEERQGYSHNRKTEMLCCTVSVVPSNLKNRFKRENWLSKKNFHVFFHFSKYFCTFFQWLCLSKSRTSKSGCKKLWLLKYTKNQGKTLNSVSYMRPELEALALMKGEISTIFGERKCSIHLQVTALKLRLFENLAYEFL